jgi:hypothetical protein
MMTDNLEQLHIDVDHRQTGIYRPFNTFNTRVPVFFRLDQNNWPPLLEAVARGFLDV